MSRRRPAAVLLAAALAATSCQPKKPKNSAELLLTERMAQVLLRENRPAEAEKAFREVIKDDPKNPEVQDGMGLSLLMQSRFDESLPYFDKALDLGMPEAACRDHADEILRRATAILPDLEGSAVDAYRVGIRAIPADGFPVVGALPGVDGFYVVATHSVRVYVSREPFRRSRSSTADR